MIRVITLKAIPTTIVKGLITQSVVFLPSRYPQTENNIIKGIVSKTVILRNIFLTNRCVPILISAFSCSDIVFVTPDSLVSACPPKYRPSSEVFSGYTAHLFNLPHSGLLHTC